jgi:hypothetical protein
MEVITTHCITVSAPCQNPPGDEGCNDDAATTQDGQPQLKFLEAICSEMKKSADYPLFEHFSRFRNSTT